MAKEGKIFDCQDISGHHFVNQDLVFRHAKNFFHLVRFHTPSQTRIFQHSRIIYFRTGGNRIVLCRRGTRSSCLGGIEIIRQEFCIKFNIVIGIKPMIHFVITGCIIIDCAGMTVCHRDNDPWHLIQFCLECVGILRHVFIFGRLQVFHNFLRNDRRAVFQDPVMGHVVRIFQSVEVRIAFQIVHLLFNSC